MGDYPEAIYNPTAFGNTNSPTLHHLATSTTRVCPMTKESRVRTDLKQPKGIGPDHSLVVLKHLPKVRPQSPVRYHLKAEQLAERQTIPRYLIPVVNQETARMTLDRGPCTRVRVIHCFSGAALGIPTLSASVPPESHAGRGPQSRRKQCT